MANIDEYISYLDRNASRESSYSGFSSFGNSKMSNARQYKDLLQKGKEIITRMEEIQKKYPEGTKVENYNEEDKQEFMQLQQELDQVQEQQEGYISFDIPDAYKEDSVSVYKYQQAGEVGKNIIAEMEELRMKYYPNASLENFSEEDKNRFSELEIQLSEIQKNQKELESKVPYMHRQQQGDLEAIKRGMMQRTSGEIPKISHYETMDSDFLLDNFKESMRLAQIAVDKELEALDNGDYERAKDCMSVYSVAYSNFSAHYGGENSAEQLTEYIENKLGEKHKEILQQKVEEYQALSPEMSNEEIISQFSDFSNISRICHTSAGKEEKDKAKEILSKVVKDKVAQLDKELIELKEHIELPENESKIEEIQTQIEELEIAWSTTLEHTIGQEKSEHKKARIEEQGIDMSEIMSDIQETAKLKGRISQTNYDRINGEVAKKSEYLEKKLAYLQQYRDIPGNEKRIAEIEGQIETMQDSWVVASNGIDLQEIMDKNTAKIEEKRTRLPEAEKELEYTLKHEPAKVGIIQRLEFEVTRLKRDIDKLESENSSIKNGTNKKYVGEHHKGRMEQEENIKAEQEAKARAEEKARIKAEQEAKAEEQARIKAEQEAKAKAEEQARIKAEQEAKAKAEEQDRIKAEQEAKAKVEEQARIKAEQEAKAKVEEQARIKAEQEAKARAEEQARIKAEQAEKAKAQTSEYMSSNLHNFSSVDEHTQFMQSSEPQIKANVDKVMDEYWSSWKQTAKTHEQQQPEKIKPQEKSIRDEVGDEFKKTEQEMQEVNNPTVDLWMNRFGGWYSSIDRVAQNVKAKFVKMKSDIIKAISEKIKQRANKQEINQDKDTNER